MRADLGKDPRFISLCRADKTIYLGNWSDYEADYKERYDKSAEVPQCIKYRTLKR